MNLLDLLAPGALFPHLIGGGGKTTLMFALAREAVASGRRVVTTTTTRILPPSSGDSPAILEGEIDPARVRGALAAHRHVTVARGRETETGKLVGFGAGELESLRAAAVADLVIVEADGSAGRPLKAHADHEPVVCPSADRVIVLVGADVIGEPLGDETVHRGALLASRFSVASGTLLDPSLVARVILEDHLGAVPSSASVTVLLNRVMPEAFDDRVRETAERIGRSPRVERVVAGDVRSGLLERLS